MIEHSEALLDDIAALALEGAHTPEDKELAAHVARCAQCAAFYAQMQTAGGIVGMVAGTERLASAQAASLKERVLASALSQRAAKPEPKVVEMAPGISWAVEPGAGMTTVRWHFTPPACSKIPLEVHPQQQWGRVMQGAFSMHYGDGRKERHRAGDSYMVTSGVEHGATIEEPTTLFEIYTPNMTEYEERYRSQLG